MKKTSTTIYLQPSLSHTFGPFTHPYEYGTIHVTGERENIEMAKSQIQKLVSEKVNGMNTKHVFNHFIVS